MCEQANIDPLFMPSLAEIVRIEELTATEKLFEIRFKNGRELGHFPGQFVEVSVFGIGEAPISVSSSPTRKGSFELVVRRVGNVTGALHKLNEGSIIGIRGPFGNGFPTEELKGKDILFVAGGIGLVPLRSLINYVLDKRDSYGRVIILFGARTPKEQLFLNELALWKKRKDVEYLETVDRGDEEWKGNVGVITTLFPKIDIDPRRTVAIIVGPPVMYRFAILEAKAKRIPDDQIIVSLERRMKCGVGKCGHCQIQNLYVCQDGPVFRYSEIKELKEAL
ncbi:MAG: oxidoreductase [Deltaproteobacteria bacterium]|nr:FAD/NAD(P)-binding protein [Deltaproteobacteria bacterium]MBW1932049.1 FAD/NAD(P)-binding protein [Deltaproteobacteria bacterium]RLB32149.1 MAG: oxidoreductase [Deltaproteobacteria bacterium]